VHVFARTPVLTLLERRSPMKVTEPVVYCAYSDGAWKEFAK